MILKRPVHIARKGQMIGEYSSSDLPSLLERGEIHSTDTCYIEETNEWQPVSEYIRSSALPKFRAAPEAPQESLEPARGTSILLGSVGLIVLGVILLVAFAIVAGAGVWIHLLQKELNSAEAQIVELENQLRNRPLQQKPEESIPQMPADRSKLVGQVTLRTESGNSEPMPGFYVALYDEKTLRDYLLSRSLDLAAFKQSRDMNQLGRILQEMPQALRKTTTDSAGRFEFQVPAQGRYILHSSITINQPLGPEIWMWFLSFATDDPLNLPVDITDDNRATRLEPEFLIKLGRPDTTTGR